MLHRDCSHCSHPAAGSGRLASCSLEQNALYDCICSTLVLVVLCSFVVLSFSFSCLSVAFSVAFSCIHSFAFHVSFTLAFVSFSLSFVALSFEFSIVAIPCHSYFRWLWTIVGPVWGVRHLQLIQCCSCSVVFNYDASHCRVCCDLSRSQL